MPDPVLEMIDGIIIRLRECLSYSRKINQPNVCVTDPYIAERALTGTEIHEADKAVYELYYAVRGQPLTSDQWESLHQKYDKDRNNRNYYAGPITSSGNWTIGLEHYTGAKSFVSRLLQERAYQVEVEAAKVPSTTYKEIIMGDVFKGISNSSIINRSTFFDAVSILEARGQKDLMVVLEEISKKVDASGNKDAGEVLEQFTEELSKDQPRASLLRRSWTALTEILPDVAKISGASAAIAKLFT